MYKWEDRRTCNHMTILLTQLQEQMNKIVTTVDTLTKITRKNNIEYKRTRKRKDDYKLPLNWNNPEPVNKT